MTAIIDSADVLAYLRMGTTATRQQRADIEDLIADAEEAVKQELGYSVMQATYTHYLPETTMTVDDTERFDVVNDRVVITQEGQTDALFLPERPVRSITSLNEDIGAYGGSGASDFSGDNLTSGTDFYLEYTTSGVSWSGKVIKGWGTWSHRARTVKVVYVAGFTAAEMDAGTIRGPNGGSIRNIKRAAILTAAAWYVEQGGYDQSTGYVGPVISERLADRSVTYSQATIKHLSMTLQLPPKAKELLRPLKRITI